MGNMITNNGYRYELLGEGKIKVYSYTGGGDVAVPDTFDGYDVAEISQLTYTNCGVQRLTLSDKPQKPMIISVCWDLRTIALPDGLGAGLAPRVMNCPIFWEFEVGEGSENYVLRDGVLFSKDGSILYRMPCACGIEHYVVPDGVKEIAPHAFNGCYNLRSVKLPEGLRKIGFSAFENLKDMAEVVIPRGCEADPDCGLFPEHDFDDDEDESY